MNAYFITSENSEDRFDTTDSLSEAIRLARSLTRSGEPGEPISIEQDGRNIMQFVLMPDGTLVQDFHILERPRALHVLNAPSPGATASLAIGEHIASLALARPP